MLEEAQYVRCSLFFPCICSCQSALISGEHVTVIALQSMMQSISGGLSRGHDYCHPLPSGNVGVPIAETRSGSLGLRLSLWASYPCCLSLPDWTAFNGSTGLLM